MHGQLPPGSPEAYKGAAKVSYNRPWHTPLDDQARDWWTDYEYPMIRFLEENGYDVSYTSGLDVATRGSLLLNHKVFLSVGHDEYWSGDRRTNVEAARNNGVNLAFFSGNEIFWKTRWNPASTAPTLPDAPWSPTRRRTTTLPPIPWTRPPGRVAGWIRGSARQRTAGGRRTR